MTTRILTNAAALEYLKQPDLWRVEEGADQDGFDVDLITRYIEKVNREDLDCLVTVLAEYTDGTNALPSPTVTTPMAGSRWERSGTWYGGRIYMREDARTHQLRLYQELHRGGRTLAGVQQANSAAEEVESTWHLARREAAPLPPNDPTLGVRYERSPIAVNPETGRLTYHVDKITAKDQDATSYERSAAEETDTALSTQDSHQSFVADGGSVPNRAAGNLKRIRNLPTQFGKFRTEIETVTAQNQEATSYEDRHDESTQTDLATQNTALASPTAVAGDIRRYRNLPTQFGKFRTEREIVTAKNQTATSYEDRHDESTETDINTQGTVLGSPTAGAGEVRRSRNLPTQFGKFRTEDETVTAKDQDATSYERSAAEETDTALSTQDSHQSFVADGGSVADRAAGNLKRIRNLPTQFGKFRTEIETVTATNQAGSYYEETAGASTIRGLATQAVSAWPAPSQVDGQINRRTNLPTQFGRYRTISERITLNKLEAEVSYNTRYGQAYAKAAQNVTLAELNAAASALTEDTVNSMSPRRNDGGKYDYTVSKRPFNPAYAIGALDPGYWRDWSFDAEAPMWGKWFPVKVFVDYFGTVSAAESFLAATPTSGYSTVVGAAGYITGITKLQGGRIHRAVRVEMDKTP